MYNALLFICGFVRVCENILIPKPPVQDAARDVPKLIKVSEQKKAYLP
jgi:hypothetical protein